MNKKRCYLWFAICIFWVGIYSMASYGMMEGETVIRVGFPIQGGLTQKDENGNYSGYTYDYLQEIAQYTGWEYEFVEVPGELNESLAAMFKMLENGEIDIMGGVLKNEQTEKLYGFPEYGFGFSYTTLSAAEQNTQINENNFYSKKGIRIAVLKNATVTRSKIKAFCLANNVYYREIEKNSEEEMLEALENREADVMVGSNLAPVHKTRVIAQFNGNQFYFATPKHRTDLLNELNRTIQTIQQTKPYFDSALHNKYFLNSSENIYFTEEESEYVKTAPPIKVAMLRSFEPIQFVDGNGALKGIGKDILSVIEKKTGLKFEYVLAKDFDEAYELLASGRADAICGIPYDYTLAQNYNLIMSGSFLSSQMVMVTPDNKSEEKSWKKIGIVDEKIVPDETDSLHIIPFDTVRETMDAVIKGGVDSAYLNLYSAEFLSHSLEYKAVRMIPQADRSAEFCIGIKKPANTVLVSIINKVLHNMSDSEMEAIIYQNTANVDGAITLTSFIETNPLLSMTFVSVLSLCALAIGVLVYWIQMKAVKRLDVENRRYLQLCELANEYIYEFDIKQDVFNCSSEFADLFSFPGRIEKFTVAAEDASRLPDSLDKDIFESLKPIITGQADKEEEYYCLMPGGEHRWFRNTQARIMADDGGACYIIGKLTDIQDEKSEKEVLEQRVMRDGLTGIYNSVASKQLIGERLLSNDKCAAVLIIDLDIFKQVNDTLGHFMGDIVLKDFAQVLEKTADRHDIAGRIGGDEFILYVNSAIDKENMEEFCRRLCEKSRRTYMNDEGKTYPITISIGAALIRESCGYLEVYQHVDRELYRAKSMGRDCYCLIEYAPETEDRSF